MDSIFERYVRLLRNCWFREDPKEDRSRLEEVLQDEKLREIYRELNTVGFIRKRLEEYRQYSVEKGFRKFCLVVGQKKTGGRLWRWTVAAAVIVLMGGSLWFMLTKKDIPDVTPKISAQIIEPGNKKAVLKLADGNMVDVGEDSMQIREEKGALISYTAGELSYRSSKKVIELVYNELIVPVAGECYIVLDDGTRVWMNADSRLKYPVKFIGKERKVYLEGEAYFDVVKDGKPFIVSTSLGEVNVMGTSFGVKAYREDEKVYTTLVSGRVSFKGSETIELLPGEQVVAFVSGKMEKRKVDIDEYIGWKEGLYVFKRQTLEAIMEDLSRWYGITVFYRNPELKEARFTGNLKRYDNINIFMSVLERTGEVKYTVHKNTIVLYR